MITLIIGGADSGKSEYAEGLLLAEAGESGGGGQSEKIYLATMEVTEAARDRIERHVRRREGSGFQTVECASDLGEVAFDRGAYVLFEDVPNYVANVMFGGEHDDVEKYLFGQLDVFLSRYDNVYFVTGDIASGGADYGELTLEYMRTLGHVQQHLAARSHRVVEVVAGLPVVLSEAKDLKEEENDSNSCSR